MIVKVFFENVTPTLVGLVSPTLVGYGIADFSRPIFIPVGEVLLHECFIS